MVLGFIDFVSTPCRGITCAELGFGIERKLSFVSTPCRGITCAEREWTQCKDHFGFLPPVGESPVLSCGYKDHVHKNMFLPPVGESPVLRLGVARASIARVVSTPCRGITCAERIQNARVDDLVCFYPLSGNHLC